MKLFFKKYGEGKPPVIIMHGLLGMLDNWHQIAGKLAEDFTVYTLDLRNHGQSPRSVEMNYDVMANDVEVFMIEEKIESAHIIGHSMGGKVALQFVSTYPNRVKKLIVVDIAPRRYEPGHREIFNALLGLDLEKISSRSEAESYLKDELPDAGVRQFLLKNLNRKDTGEYTWKMNLPVIHENYYKIIEEIKFSRAILKPTLFVKGEKSDYITIDDREEIRRVFMHVKFADIPDAGHWVHAENPVDFLKETVKFLKED